MSDTFKIAEEDIALYIAGELSSSEKSIVEAAIKEDPELEVYIKQLQSSDQILAENLDAAYSIPYDFKRTVEDILESQSQKTPSLFSNIVNMRNIVSGGVGAGIVAAMFFGFGTTQLAYRSGEVVSTFNYPQLYEWSVSDKFAIQFSIFNADQTLKNIVVGDKSKIKVGEFFRVSVMPLEDGIFELKAVDQSSKSVNLIKKTYATKGRVMSHPVQKISGLGEHEFQFFFNNNLRQSIVLVIEE